MTQGCQLSQGRHKDDGSYRCRWSYQHLIDNVDQCSTWVSFATSGPSQLTKHGKIPGPVNPGRARIDAFQMLYRNGRDLSVVVFRKQAASQILAHGLVCTCIPRMLGRCTRAALYYMAACVRYG